MAEQYIPVGTPFKDAEEILRYAGFKIHKPNPGQRKGFPDQYNVVGAIVPYDQGFFYRVNLYVDLMPKSPGDYTNISSRAAWVAALPTLGLRGFFDRLIEFPGAAKRAPEVKLLGARVWSVLGDYTRLLGLVSASRFLWNQRHNWFAGHGLGVNSELSLLGVV